MNKLFFGSTLVQRNKNSFNLLFVSQQFDKLMG